MQNHTWKVLIWGVVEFLPSVQDITRPLIPGKILIIVIFLYNFIVISIRLGFLYIVSPTKKNMDNVMVKITGVMYTIFLCC